MLVPARRRPLTADELALRSGVSKSTVFRYYAGKPLRPFLRDAIETVLRKQSPGPDTPRLDEILVSVSPAHRSFRGYSEVIQGLIERMELVAGQVRILPGPVVPEAHGPQSGWIILGKTLAEEQADAAALEQAGQPFVLVNREYGSRSWSTVGVSMRRAAADAVQYLIGRGHERIAVLTQATDLFQVAREKVTGYRQAFSEARVPVPQDLFFQIDSRPFDQAMEELFDVGMTACFCVDDELAFSVLRWAAQRGIHVPGQLAVMGFNDIEPSRFFSPSLSSVRIPFHHIGGAAVDSLELLLADPVRRGLRLELRHELVEREST